MRSDRRYLCCLSRLVENLQHGRGGEGRTGKRAARTLNLCNSRVPRGAYFAVPLVYLLTKIIVMSRTYHQVLSRRCIRHQYDTLFPVAGRAWVAVRKMFHYVLHM